MAIADDFSVAVNGDIRYTGSGTNYTVLQLHRFLQDLADDAQSSGDDLVDITTDTPSDRSTDQIIALNSPYNIDDTAARHLYDGSVSQDGGNTLYSGLRVLGSVVAGTEIMVVQDDKVLPAYWGTGINEDTANAIIMRLLVKSRADGADIDGKRILVLARELGDQYREFGVTLGLANSVAAISTAADLNNETADSTIEGWSTIANTEGYQLIDIDGNGSDEEYYAQLDKGSQSLNDVYEWTKQKSQRAHIVDSGTDTGSDFVVDNATILGQGQEFSARAVAEKLVEARFQLKIGAGTPTGTLVAELYDSDDSSPAAPTGAVLATSEPVLASLVGSSYTEVIFRFDDNVTMTADQEYFIVIRHADGDSSNYFHVRGLASSGTDDGNRAQDNGSWAGVAADDLWFEVKGSPVWHSQAGEKFRGITHQVPYDAESGGPFTEDEIVYWGTELDIDGITGTFQVGEYVTFEPDGGGAIKNAGKVLYVSGSVMRVALDNIAGSILLDNDDITGLTSAATAKINSTITDDDKAGGEGRLLALDDNGATGIVWIQLVAGAAPVDGLAFYGRLSAATADVDGSFTSRTVSPEFIGQSTGSNLIGAYGIGFDTDDIGASDKFFDLTNTQRTPPNNVTFTVTGLVSGEDRVLVGPRTGTALEKGQFLLATALTGGTETAIVVKDGAEDGTPLPGDTPAQGNTNNTRLRVQLDTGIYRRQAYLSWTGSTFTIASADYSGANAAGVDNDVFVAYIDVLADGTSESFTAVYQIDRDLRLRVRDGGATPIKTFEANAVFGSSAASVAAIRNSDA
jgi:hypothetical protein